ncbi:hypothetical protein LXL04_037934 [Taraxacum kok-saghyz]
MEDAFNGEIPKTPEPPAPPPVLVDFTNEINPTTRGEGLEEVSTPRKSQARVGYPETELLEAATAAGWYPETEINHRFHVVDELLQLLREE